MFLLWSNIVIIKKILIYGTHHLINTSNLHCIFLFFSSHELQTCDWPRNVGCGEAVSAVSTAKATEPRPRQPIQLRPQQQPQQIQQQQQQQQQQYVQQRPLQRDEAIPKVNHQKMFKTCFIGVFIKKIVTFTSWYCLPRDYL